MPNVSLSLSVDEIRSILTDYGFNIYLYNGMEYAQKDSIDLPLIKAFRAHLKIRLSSSSIQGEGLSKITVGPIEPENPSTGDLWIQTNE